MGQLPRRPRALRTVGDGEQVVPFLWDVLKALDARELDEPLLKAATLARHPERWPRDGRHRE